jgi:hypothetical protein
MLPPRPPLFFGYVKVELLARYPHRWGWRVFKDEGDFAVFSSEPLFCSAEAAWSDGRQVLAMLEQGETVEGLRAMMQIR